MKIYKQEYKNAKLNIDNKFVVFKFEKGSIAIPYKPFPFKFDKFESKFKFKIVIDNAIMQGDGFLSCILHLNKKGYKINFHYSDNDYLLPEFTIKSN